MTAKICTSHLGDPAGQALCDGGLLGAGEGIEDSAQVVAGAVEIRPQPDGLPESEDAVLHVSRLLRWALQGC